MCSTVDWPARRLAAVLAAALLAAACGDSGGTAGGADQTTTPLDGAVADARAADAEAMGDAAHDGLCALVLPLALDDGAASVTGLISAEETETPLALPAGTCAPRGVRGAARIYRLPLEAGRRYRVTLTPGPGFDPVLVHLSGCAEAAAHCMAGVDSGVEGMAESLVLTGVAGGEQLVAVATAHPPGELLASGSYTLTVQRLDAPANDQCAAAAPLTLGAGSTTVTGDLSGAQPDAWLAGAPCGGQTAQGPTVYYRVDLVAGTTYRIRADGQGFNEALFLRTDCAAKPDSCVAAADRHVYQAETLIVTPSTSASHVIAVAGRSALDAGPFQLSVEPITTPANDLCAAATAITLTDGAATLQGHTMGAANDVAFSGYSCTGEATEGPDVFYSVDFAPDSAYRVRLEPQNFDGSLYVFKSCADVAATCGKGMGADLFTTAPESVLVPPVFPPPPSPTYRVGVDGRKATDLGFFSLSVQEFPLPTGDSCAAAEPLALPLGRSVHRGHTFNAGDEVQLTEQGCAGAITWGPDVFYEVQLAAGHTYRFAAEGVEHDVALYLFSTCGDVQSSCVAGASGPSAALVRRPTSDGTYLLGVDGIKTGDRGAFTITVDNLPPATNDSCATAQPLALTTPLTSVNGNTMAATNAVTLGATDCTGGSTKGRDLFYSATLEAGATYLIHLDSPDFDAALYRFSDCGDVQGSCTAGMGADSYVTLAETVVVTPPVTASYILGVDSGDKEGAGEFSLTLVRAADNSACAAAQQLTLGAGPLSVAGDTSQAANTIALDAGGCTGSATPGPELFYALQLTAGETYNLKLTPGAGFDPALYILGGCSGPQGGCPAGWGTDVVGQGVAEMLTLTPAASGPYLVVVDSYSPLEMGTFTLEVSREP